MLIRNKTVTIQPFREEIDRVIATYVMDDAPRQLNLSARERKQLLIALSHTTHPTAFRQVAWSVESTLRMQAHPNFIRCQYQSFSYHSYQVYSVVEAFQNTSLNASYRVADTHQGASAMATRRASSLPTFSGRS